jgi:hypothetical protein
MNTFGEIVYVSLLSAEIIDTDFGVWDTTTISRLNIRFPFTISVAPSRSATHLQSVMMKILLLPMTTIQTAASSSYGRILRKTLHGETRNFFELNKSFQNNVLLIKKNK